MLFIIPLYLYVARSLASNSVLVYNNISKEIIEYSNNLFMNMMANNTSCNMKQSQQQNQQQTENEKDFTKENLNKDNDYIVSLTKEIKIDLESKDFNLCKSLTSNNSESQVWSQFSSSESKEQRTKFKSNESLSKSIEQDQSVTFFMRKQETTNVWRIFESESAYYTSIYSEYQQSAKNGEKKNIDVEGMHVPIDFASHLNQMKLCEQFPDIPYDTVVDILDINGNDYSATVAFLQSTMKIHNNCDESDVPSYLTAEEAKRFALREFKESRNLAAHHWQLKSECYQKAKEAIQRGNYIASIYFSQIGNLHNKKIDMYNHRAANYIVDAHVYTHRNSDLLDLHYLYSIEALVCLDLFLDHHITTLREVSRNYKYVFIITGRGKHSAGGVPIIKNKVKERLKERCLRWSEVNPGFLRTKIFPDSHYSKDI